jgi:hypothetical protein
MTANSKVSFIGQNLNRPSGIIGVLPPLKKNKRSQFEALRGAERPSAWLEI